MSQAQAAKAVGLKSQASVAELEKTGQGSSRIAAFATAYRCSVNWLADDNGPPLFDVAPGAGTNTAPIQGVHDKLYKFTVLSMPPVGMSWEAAVSTAESDLPNLFFVEMPDDSLAGYIDQGTEIVFDKHQAPRVGKPVFIETADGRRFIRNYAEGRAGSWRALATSDAFLSFDSSQEPLTILASFKWRG